MGLLPMRMGDWMWDWAWSGWGWFFGIGFILILGIFLLPWFFFLLNLQNLLNRVSPVNRAMPSGHVWLNFIPFFNLGWFIYTVVKIRDSVRAEYQSRGWRAEGDFAYNLGMATGILAIATFIIGWVPVLGWALGIAQLICWILYWLRTNDLKNRLEVGAYPRPGVYQQYGQPYGQSYGQPPAGGAPMAYSPPKPAPPQPTSPQAWSHAGPGTTAAAATGAAVGAVAGAAAGGDSQRAAPLACGACGTGYAPEDRFCRACGMPLPQTGAARAGALHGGTSEGSGPVDPESAGEGPVGAEPEAAEPAGAGPEAMEPDRTG